MDNKKYISSVKLVDGSVYNIKDTEAHEILNSIFNEEIIIDCGGIQDDFNEETIIDCGGAPIDAII